MSDSPDDEEATVCPDDQSIDVGMDDPASEQDWQQDGCSNCITRRCATAGRLLDIADVDYGQRGGLPEALHH